MKVIFGFFFGSFIADSITWALYTTPGYYLGLDCLAASLALFVLIYRHATR